MTDLAIRLDAIVLDASIQCRASIDAGVVNEYAAAMLARATFPPVALFDDNGKYWIGDGWHRVLASKQAETVNIEATVAPGGRAAALKYALSANNSHGLRRTNADKRCCVEIALRAPEYANLSSRAIADLCAVGKDLVESVRQLAESASSSRTGAEGTGEIPQLKKRVGADGKARKQPAKKATTKAASGEPKQTKATKLAATPTAKPKRSAKELAEEYSRRINHDFLELPAGEKREFVKRLTAIIGLLTPDKPAAVETATPPKTVDPLIAEAVACLNTIFAPAMAKEGRKRTRKPPQKPAGDAQATAAGAA